VRWVDCPDRARPEVGACGFFSFSWFLEEGRGRESFDSPTRGTTPGGGRRGGADGRFWLFEPQKNPAQRNTMGGRHTQSRLGQGHEPVPHKTSKDARTGSPNRAIDNLAWANFELTRQRGKRVGHGGISPGEPILVQHVPHNLVGHQAKYYLWLPEVSQRQGRTTRREFGVIGLVGQGRARREVSRERPMEVTVEGYTTGHDTPPVSAGVMAVNKAGGNSGMAGHRPFDTIRARSGPALVTTERRCGPTPTQLAFACGSNGGGPCKTRAPAPVSSFRATSDSLPSHAFFQAGGARAN